jgi:hypothetical protein
MERRFEPVAVLDWYDGTVAGVVRIGGAGTLYLAALLYWAQERELRVYALVPVEGVDVERLASRASDWSRLVSEVRHAFAEANREISIICVDERTDTVVAEKRVPSSDVLVHVVSDVEEALAPERARWLDALVPRDEPEQPW